MAVTRGVMTETLSLAITTEAYSNNPMSTLSQGDYDHNGCNDNDVWYDHQGDFMWLAPQNMIVILLYEHWELIYTCSQMSVTAIWGAWWERTTEYVVSVGMLYDEGIDIERLPHMHECSWIIAYHCSRESYVQGLCCCPTTRIYISLVYTSESAFT